MTCIDCSVFVCDVTVFSSVTTDVFVGVVGNGAGLIGTGTVASVGYGTSTVCGDAGNSSVYSDTSVSFGVIQGKVDDRWIYVAIISDVRISCVGVAAIISNVSIQLDGTTQDITCIVSVMVDFGTVISVNDIVVVGRRTDKLGIRCAIVISVVLVGCVSNGVVIVVISNSINGLGSI